MTLLREGDRYPFDTPDIESIFFLMQADWHQLTPSFQYNNCFLNEKHDRFTLRIAENLGDTNEVTVSGSGSEQVFTTS